MTATAVNARAAKRDRAIEEILKAAAGAIAESGYFGMSMRDLAAATGKSLAAFYNYFRSKEDLLLALQTRAFETLNQTAHDALQGVSDPVARLHLFIANHVQYVADHPDVMRVLVHEAAALPPERRQAVRALKEEYFTTASGIVRAVIEHGCGGDGAKGAGPAEAAEIERATYSIFGMLNWVWGWYEPRLHGTPQDVARTMHGIAVCGLITHCPHRAIQDAMDRRLANIDRPPLTIARDAREETDGN